MCLIVTCCLWHYIQCCLKAEFLFCVYVAYLYSWIRWLLHLLGLPTIAGIQICCGSKIIALSISSNHISISLLGVQYFTNGTQMCSQVYCGILSSRKFLIQFYPCVKLVLCWFKRGAESLCRLSANAN